ncbi:MAG: DGQHR domain-containing protein DpdB [Myxococcota bacterium]
MPRPASKLRRRALRLRQPGGHPLYMFSLRGDELLRIADISRVSRSEAGKLLGYQRPEVRRHVKDIVEYLNSDDVLFPNSLILALDSKVKFTKSRGPNVGDDLVEAGTLEIPLPNEDEEKPAWIVDGQQRALAISKSERKDLAVPVNAFVADAIDLQRDQFLRVNNTRPLPRGLITELLPEVTTPLPARLAARKIPSALCDLLAADEESPFYGMIRRASTSSDKKKGAVVTDTSVINMLEESLGSASGCLFPYRNIATGETDFDGIRNLLFTYWSAVANVFHDAWGKSPGESRLMHGTGIRSMGRLMDKVMAGIDPADPRAMKKVEKELAVIAPVCRWTSGTWEDLNDTPWDAIENTPRHVRVLSNFLIRTYVQSRGTRS